MAKSPRVISIDLDGTLASQDKGWRGFHFIGKPVPRVVEILRREHRAGSYIILHTCRVTNLDNKVHPFSLDTIRAWLKKHSIFIDEIWMGVGKPYANVYMDDRAWNVCCSECNRREAEKRKRKQ